MVIGLWVMMTKRVSVLRVISSSRSQKRSTLWSSSGASTSSSTQIGAGLVRNTAKMRASAVSACSPPDKSDSVAATEQFGEQPLEMRADHLERREQALARFLVQALDALAQPLDRLDQIVA